MQRAFQKISGYIEGARRSPDAEIVSGGEMDDSVGYFIRPVLIRAKKPDYRTMTEEIFGPVVTVYVYPEREWAVDARTCRSHVSLCTHGCGFCQRSKGD